VNPAAPTPSPRPHSPADELAKAWLVGVIERTPMDRITELDLGLLSAEAIPLIAGILGGLELEDAGELMPHTEERARALAGLRHGDRASSEIPRDLAVLQSVLIASIYRDVSGRMRTDFERSAQRLAEIFGSVQAAVAEGLVGELAPAGTPDERPAPLPGSDDLDHWLQVMIAGYRRYGHPFALALVDVEGLGPINEAYGGRSGDWMSTAVAAVIRNQIRIVDQAFRLRDDEYCVLAPNVSAGRLRPMADRLARVVDASQSVDAPRIGISVGVSACPEHGHDGGQLLAVASEALDAARATGQPVEVAVSNGHRAVSNG
jgi:diguanylate cyclase (GGDEF)-like protein